MGASAPITSAGQQMLADLITGVPKPQTMEHLAQAVGVSVKADAVPIAESIAHAGASAGKTASKAMAEAQTVVEKTGVAAKAEVAKDAAAIPATRAEFKYLKAATDKLTQLEDTPQARVLFASLAAESIGPVMEAVLQDLEEAKLPGVAATIRKLWRNLDEAHDTEELAAAIASKGIKDKVLTADQASGFVRAVHDRLCETLIDHLEDLIKAPDIVGDIRAALAALRDPSQKVPELMPLFRERVRAIVATRGDAILTELVDRIVDPVVRRAFLDRLFDLMCEKYAKELLATNFDSDGKRRVLTALASFRKDYTDLGRAKALENLIGWMYEATKEVADAVRANAEAFRGRLGKAMSETYPEFGLEVREAVTMHFEVTAPSLTGTSLRQATDLMATVAVSVGQGKGQRTVHILATALESKGERGVLSGIKQVVERLLKRFRHGAPVTSEHGSFTVGKDLFLSVEDAVRSLNPNLPAATLRSIAIDARAGAIRYQAFVVSPLERDVALQRYPENFGPEGNLEGKATYLPHSISRQSMLKAAKGIAAHFGL